MRSAMAHGTADASCGKKEVTRPLLVMLVVFGGCATAVCTSAASAAQPLGRLFFTPAERAQLDVARTQKQRAPQLAGNEPATPAMPPAPQIITYSGIVRRSDGTAVVWLNNRPVDAKDALPGLALKGRIRPDGAMTLQVPQTGASVELKVGQRAELQTGTVAETRPERAAKPESTPAKPPEVDAAEKKTEPAPASKPDKK
jgi:hypothetical protein